MLNGYISFVKEFIYTSQYSTSLLIIFIKILTSGQFRHFLIFWRLSKGRFTLGPVKRKIIYNYYSLQTLPTLNK